ncbi:MAG TPA: benzoyl-CoA 2,3-epoxidase subunit BoxB [Ilumatobacteraceae bacterium]|nr:benzoyl-CoA 2,3-epoxidase subunit BoxB [Ilumatobacteraceae bacterium]
MEKMSTVDIDAKIPNNVDLAGDLRLQRALESWQPKFIQWWKELGPVAFKDNPVYLRTAISVGQDGWANFDHVQMPDYRWGVFLAEPEQDRRIAFGDHIGKPVWQEVPGEYRADLRRLLVVQGDTEPASVEQQRQLCLTAPSLYDLRNLFQVNVEEGRHLWAMVYLLHRYFGRDGRDEADEMLERHSGDSDKPRILGAFNEPTPDWLSFYMFTYFTDRDGKFQLASLRESAFDPLSRTCDFMLKEEAHHMFVGATGVARVVERTVELMKEHDTDDVRPYGGIDVATLQRYLNFHYSVSLDLFGAETSTNAANYFGAGLKGRFQEERRDDDHQLHGATRLVPHASDDGVGTREASALSALNETLRDDYIVDCQKGVDRWNRALADVDASLELPHVGFSRAVGTFGKRRVSPRGEIISDAEWESSVSSWLPTASDREFVESLMVGVSEPGKMAGWVAPPSKGIHAKPVDFEYVKV